VWYIRPTTSAGGSLVLSDGNTRAALTRAIALRTRSARKAEQRALGNYTYAASAQPISGSAATCAAAFSGASTTNSATTMLATISAAAIQKATW
jgi:hypothetical protein